mmetsp:Transcript_47223/g.137379  ORF Transcript_47223/g.137379 Transcript_47223/m.137379 type:complete len:701 (+) Transcript_47223:146-2248(+)
MAAAAEDPAPQAPRLTAEAASAAAANTGGGDDMLTKWAARSPEEREGALKVGDPELVRTIDLSMRMLWTAEIQARQFGVQGPVHPFDHSQLPLLSAMQFDGFGDEFGGGAATLVKWPKEFVQDPAVLTEALRSALRPGGAGRRGGAPKAMKPQRWASLLQPSPKSWVDFERQIARLVEQLVLRAVPQADASTKRGDAAAASGSGADGAAATDAEADADSDSEEAGAAPKQSPARALKRARQRERRRMGKALARAGIEGSPEQVAEVAAVAAQAAAAQVAAAAAMESSTGALLGALTGSPLLSAHSGDEGGVDVQPRARWGSMSTDETESVTEATLPAKVETNVLKVMRAQFAQRSRQLPPSNNGAPASASIAAGPAVVGNPPTACTAPPSPAARPSEPAAAQLGEPAAPGSARGRANADDPAPAPPPAARAPPTAAQDPAVAPASALLDEDDEEIGASSDSKEDERPIILAGFGGDAFARGLGRGRPMGSQDGSPWRSLHGRGMGRGRALAPPPGLQGLTLHRQQNVPGGLSRSWLPGGPPIPEDEDEAPQASLVWSPWHGMDRDADVSADMAAGLTSGWLPDLELPDSMWRKAMTPAADWGRTPSTLASPPEMLSPAMRPPVAFGPFSAVTGSSMDAVMAAAAASAASPMLQAHAIPMYVTVPVAVAQCCPHCHRHFALHPETGVPIAPPDAARSSAGD